MEIVKKDNMLDTIAGMGIFEPKQKPTSMRKTFSATPVSLTNTIVPFLRLLEEKGNSIVAIHAIHKITFPGVISHAGDSDKLIAAAKTHLMQTTGNKAQGAKEKLTAGHLVQVTEGSLPIAILTTQQPVTQELLKRYSFKLVSTSDTRDVVVNTAEPVSAEA